MTRDTTTLTAADTADVGDDWNRLAAGRGTQADFYNTYAWFRSWADLQPTLAERAIVPTVLEGGSPVALLPLVRGRWASASSGNAPRCRPVLAAGDPDPDVMARLVAEIGRSGVREIMLRGVPDRDPATPVLIRALQDDGMTTAVYTQKARDNTVPTVGNELAGRALRKLASSAGARERRVRPFWDIEVKTFGGDAAPLEEGLELYAEVRANSWKGPEKPGGRRRRRAFLDAADELGWARLLVLTMAGRPVAGNVFLRLGDVAFGWTTAYDEGLAALSPGFILHKYVQDAIYADQPELVDVLPGRSPFKSLLDVQQTPILTVRAYRPALVRGATFPVRRWVQQHGKTARHRFRTTVGQKRAEFRRRHPEAPPTRRLLVAPAPAGAPGQVTEVDLTTNTPLQRYLAVVHGLRSAQAVESRWPGERWAHVAGDGEALVRLAPTPADGDGAGWDVRDVVPLVVGTELRSVTAVVARHLGGPLTADLPTTRPDVATEADLPSLPWAPALVAGTATAGAPT